MKLAAVGDNCVDVYENLGKTYPGGNPVNVAVYFKRLGGESSYTGAVGTDEAGKTMIAALEGKGVDASHIQVLPGNTATTQVNLIDGERVFGDYDEGVLADFKLSDDDIDFLCSHDLVVTGLWGMVENDLWKIQERGVPVAFDAATRPDDEAAQIATPHTDILFFASDDGDTPEIRAKLAELHAKGPKIVVVTLGVDGSLAFDGEKYYVGGIVPCEVVDTMGAGDSFIAGFLYGTLAGQSIEERMHTGAANSSVTIGYEGAW